MCYDCCVALRKLNTFCANRLDGLRLCVRCGKFPQLRGMTRHGNSHNICQTCYLKHISRCNLGSMEYADALLQKLEDQNYRCPYSGDRLVLGDHIWVDHIMPRSRFPELVHDIDNIEWVTEVVNRMKQDQTPDEFLALIKQIHNHHHL